MMGVKKAIASRLGSTALGRCGGHGAPPMIVVLPHGDRTLADNALRDSGLVPESRFQSDRAQSVSTDIDWAVLGISLT